mgnify:CR=1 FL=1
MPIFIGFIASYFVPLLTRLCSILADIKPIVHNNNIILL